MLSFPQTTASVAISGSITPMTQHTHLSRGSLCDVVSGSDGGLVLAVPLASLPCAFAIEHTTCDALLSTIVLVANYSNRAYGVVVVKEHLYKLKW